MADWINSQQALCVLSKGLIIRNTSSHSLKDRPTGHSVFLVSFLNALCVCVCVSFTLEAKRCQEGDFSDVSLEV